MSAGEHPAELLADLAESLSLGRGAWSSRETCRVAEIPECDIDPKALGDATFELIEAAHDRFGEALRLRLEATPVQVLTETDLADPARVAEFRDELGELNGAVSAWLQLDKSKWWSAEFGGDGSTRVCWFVSGETLSKVLSGSLKAVEESLFADSETVVLLTPDRGIDLAGEHLRIASWGAEVNPMPAPSDAMSCARMRTKVRWYQPYLAVVTPFHFALHGSDPKGELSAHLARLFLSSFVLFTADVTNGEPGALHSTYVGATGTVELAHDEAPTGQRSLAAVGSLRRLLAWVCCQERLYTDRLTHAQTLIVSELQRFEPTGRWSALVRLAERIQTLTMRRWKSFIEAKLHAHEDLVRDHMKAVESAADRYQDQASDLVKSLSGSMAAGAGVFVGTWIAMVGKVDVTAELFRAVVAVYAVYLAVFPLLMKSLAARSQAALVERKFGNRKKRVVAILGEEEAQELEEEVVTRARTTFLRWLWASVVVNLLLVVASTWGGFHAHHLLPP